MSETTYSYSVADDFPDAAVNIATLETEIRASSIVTALERIDSSGDDVDVVFKDALSTGDRTILDGDTTDPAGGLIAAHDNTPVSQVDEVHLQGVNEGPEKSLRVYPAPNRPGFYLCDRDIKVRTSIYDAGSSFEDWKVDVATKKRIDWDEVIHVGTFKGDEDVGYTACTDQTDADTNATLSIWDFHPHDQSVDKNPIPYDLKGGALAVVNELVAPKDAHQLYAMVAPNIPNSYGGSIRFFDGYLEPYEGGEISAISQLAVFMNVDVSPEATRLRIYIYHPPGAKQSHIFRVIMFRPIGTF